MCLNLQPNARVVHGTAFALVEPKLHQEIDELVRDIYRHSRVLREVGQERLDGTDCKTKIRLFRYQVTTIG